MVGATRKGRKGGGVVVSRAAGARNAIFGFSNARDESARCISVRIDSDKDRAFWMSPGAVANSYPARATSYISEYLRRRPAPSAPVSILRRRHPRLRRPAISAVLSDRLFYPPREAEDTPSRERESVEYLFSRVDTVLRPPLITCIISDWKLRHGKRERRRKVEIVVQSTSW